MCVVHFLFRWQNYDENFNYRLKKNNYVINSMGDIGDCLFQSEFFMKEFFSCE